jgi:hypothetical protein
MVLPFSRNTLDSWEVEESLFLDLVRPCLAMGFSCSWLGERLRERLLLVALGLERGTLMKETSGDEDEECASWYSFETTAKDKWKQQRQKSVIDVAEMQIMRSK